MIARGGQIFFLAATMALAFTTSSRAATPEEKAPTDWISPREGMVIPFVTDRGLEMVQLQREIPNIDPEDISGTRYFEAHSQPQWRRVVETGDVDHLKLPWELGEAGQIYRVSFYKSGGVGLSVESETGDSEALRGFLTRPVQEKPGVTEPFEKAQWFMKRDVYFMGKRYAKLWYLAFPRLSGWESALNHQRLSPLVYAVFVPKEGPLRWVNRGEGATSYLLNDGVRKIDTAEPDAKSLSLTGNIRVLAPQKGDPVPPPVSAEVAERMREVVQVEEAMIRALNADFRARKAGEAGREGFRPGEEGTKKERGEAEGEGEGEVKEGPRR